MKQLDVCFTHMYVYNIIIMFVKEPKLTRSRVRQAVASSVASGSINPKKIVSLDMLHTPLNTSVIVHTYRNSSYFHL